MGVKGGQRIAMVVGVVALLVCVPASAGAASFGADLSQPANSTATCGDQLQAFPTNPIAGSCMWFSVGGNESFYGLAASGTVTAVRVEVGPVTGPMQVVVVRGYYENTTTPGKPFLACCIMQQYGPTFTPQANGVTTVPTSLAMREDPTPAPDDTSTIAVNDQLALAVLSPEVPVPASLTGGGPTLKADFGWYPAPSQAGVPAPSPNVDQYNWDFSGYQILMNADFETGGGAAPAAGGGPAAVPGPTATLLPTINLPKLTIPVKGNTATVPIQCLVVDCTGTLNLQSAPQAGAARASSTKKPKKPKIVSYGTAKFSLKAGTTGKVKVKLNTAGRKLVKAQRKAKVWANVLFSSGGGKPKSARVTLKR
jgi:hypothetical protein